MNWRVGGICTLLFLSGFSALVYQTVWFREFRLIFGASTASTAAVLAIFMGGLGLGSAILGRRAERHSHPLALYGILEIGIAVAAAISPFLLMGAQWLYISAGGTITLGNFGGTALRILLGVLVMGLPAFLMGGTLPAAVRAATDPSDEGRRSLALLYGLNTLGAVTGTLVSTFYLLEWHGNRMTLWMACILNLGVAFVAWRAGSKMTLVEAEPRPASDPSVGNPPVKAAPAAFVYFAAAMAGVAFFVLEMVWYRMLSPLLGGSTFTFGLILGVALAGIGLGGAFYGLVSRGKPATLNAFALTCALEALAVAIPFALGDRIAVLALQLDGLWNLGFGGTVMAWSIITLIVVFPTAFIAGIQFPLLISLLGSGREGVARQTGNAYAFNTSGAILGALAGGFGLMPLLTAPGIWRLVGGLLLLLALLSFAVALSTRRPQFNGFVAVVLALVAGFLLFSTGPTAFWRHSPIGAGRVFQPQEVRSINNLLERMHFYRRSTAMEMEGRESSVGILDSSAYAFVVNGKSDGNSILDVGTQVMSGMLAATLHPDPKNILVIGLGTGSTAGWLASIPSVDNVDVVELEPSLARMAELCAPVNANAMENPKMNVIYADGRELLLTTKSKYDVIVSEPSNPFRAGIASLFTKEFYEAAQERLNSNGIFAQWMQAYEVDAQTIRTVITTVAEVFPFVEIWQTQPGDLLLIGSMEARVIDPDQMRARLDSEPFKEAMQLAWKLEGLEGFLSRFLCNNEFVQAVANIPTNQINTDDQNTLEFGFARMMGRFDEFSSMEIANAAQSRQMARPALTDPARVDWDMVEALSPTIFTTANVSPALPEAASDIQRRSASIHRAFLTQRFGDIVKVWEDQKWAPAGMVDFVILARALVENNDPRADSFILMVGERFPADADLLRARQLFLQDRPESAMDALESAIVRVRQSPKVTLSLLLGGLNLGHSICLKAENPELTRRWYDALKEPFALAMLEENRIRSRLAMSRLLPATERDAASAEVLALWEPNVPWEKGLLSLRLIVYNNLKHPLLSVAERDYLRFLSRTPEPLESDDLPPPTQAASAPAVSP